MARPERGKEEGLTVAELKELHEHLSRLSPQYVQDFISEPTKIVMAEASSGKKHVQSNRYNTHAEWRRSLR